MMEQCTSLHEETIDSWSCGPQASSRTIHAATHTGLYNTFIPRVFALQLELQLAVAHALHSAGPAGWQQPPGQHDAAQLTVQYRTVIMGDKSQPRHLAGEPTAHEDCA